MMENKTTLSMLKIASSLNFEQQEFLDTEIIKAYNKGKLDFKNALEQKDTTFSNVIQILKAIFMISCICSFTLLVLMYQSDISNHFFAPKVPQFTQYIPSGSEYELGWRETTLSVEGSPLFILNIDSNVKCYRVHRGPNTDVNLGCVIKE